MEDMRDFQKGQLIITLILVMTIALAIGLSIVQRSLVDVSTSTKTEQSSRAFSAAEAGIEKALLAAPGQGTATTPINDSSVSTTDRGLVPVIVASGNQQAIFELPLLAKEDTAQVWLADPNTSDGDGIPTEKYKQNNIDVYWGNSGTDKAGVFVKVIYYLYNQTSNDGYKSYPIYLDSDATRAAGSNFTTGSCPFYTKLTNFSLPGAVTPDRRFYCYKQISGWPANARLVLLRFRMLYNTSSQPLAVQAAGSCGDNCNIPPQARMITSTGTSGATGNIQRKIQLFKQDKVVPDYFDYAIFSAGDINKPTQ